MIEFKEKYHVSCKEMKEEICNGICGKFYKILIYDSCSSFYVDWVTWLLYSYYLEEIND